MSSDIEEFGYEREPWEVEQDEVIALVDLTEHGAGIDVHAEGYVPTLETVRATYATEYYMTNVSVRGQSALERADAFDRFLADHDRNVMQRTLDAVNRAARIRPMTRPILAANDDAR